MEISRIDVRIGVPPYGERFGLGLLTVVGWSD
jgi:hypothetical protein